MGLPALYYEAVTETYLDVRELIFKIVYQFANRYGGDVEELTAEANLIFMRAYESYNGTSKFTSWMTLLIWKILLEKRRRSLMRWARTKQHNKDMDIYPCEQPAHFVEFMDGLSADAKTVVEIALSAPEQVREYCKPPSFSSQRTSGKDQKRAIKRYLREQGWSHKRIARSFQEIGERLSA